MSDRDKRRQSAHMAYHRQFLAIEANHLAAATRSSDRGQRTALTLHVPTPHTPAGVSRCRQVKKKIGRWQQTCWQATPLNRRKTPHRFRDLPLESPKRQHALAKSAKLGRGSGRRSSMPRCLRRIPGLSPSCLYLVYATLDYLLQLWLTCALQWLINLRMSQRQGAHAQRPTLCKHYRKDSETDISRQLQHNKCGHVAQQANALLSSFSPKRPLQILCFWALWRSGTGNCLVIPGGGGGALNWPPWDFGSPTHPPSDPYTIYPPTHIPEGGGGRVAPGHGVGFSLLAFAGAYRPLAIVHSNPL